MAFYDFCNQIGVPYDKADRELLDAWMEIGKSTGWWCAFESICFCFERHSVLKIDEEGRLHCEDGPAMAFKDGHQIHCWHGVQVKSYVIKNPEKLTLEDIDSETNAEVRRIKTERFGFARYLAESGAEELHRDDFGILYRKIIKDDEPLIMVKVCNCTAESDGSFKDYTLRVHPELRPLPPEEWPREKQLEWIGRQKPQEFTAHNAIASTFGKRGEEYAPFLET